MALIAPNYCIGCKKIDRVICSSCASELVLPSPPECVLCGLASLDWEVCGNCQVVSPIGRVWVVAEYEGVVGEAVKMLKFKRALSVYRDLAQVLDVTLPYFENDWVVMAVPTANNRVRQRGYGHVELIVREFGGLRGLRVCESVRRLHDARQVGADRATRLTQMQDAFYCTNNDDIHGKRILLIDDVVTTGATLSALANLLVKNGAAAVVGAVLVKRSGK